MEFLKRVKEFFEEVAGEFRRVNWPSRQDVAASTAVVLVVVFVLAMYLGAVDVALWDLKARLLGQGHNARRQEAAQSEQVALDLDHARIRRRRVARVRVGAGDVRLGHGETAADLPIHQRLQPTGARIAKVQSTSFGPSAVMITLPGLRSQWQSPSPGGRRSISRR